MGGTISVIIKKDDKNIFKMKRWTNSFPSLFKNVNFLNKSETHINNYLKRWNEMNEDYEANKSSGKFEYPMTPVYIDGKNLMLLLNMGLFLLI